MHIKHHIVPQHVSRSNCVADGANETTSTTLFSFLRRRVSVAWFRGEGLKRSLLPLVDSAFCKLTRFMHSYVCRCWCTCPDLIAVNHNAEYNRLFARTVCACVLMDVRACVCVCVHVWRCQMLSAGGWDLHMSQFVIAWGIKFFGVISPNFFF